MTNVKEFNQQNLPLIRAAINAAMEQVEKEFGIKVTFPINLTYTPESFGYKLTVSIDSGETDEELARQNWDKYCGRFGLTPEDFDKKILWKGQRCAIIGLAERSKTYPIRVKVGGRTFKFKASSIERGFSRTK